MKQSEVAREAEIECKKEIKQIMMDKGYRNLFQFDGYSYTDLRTYYDIEYEKHRDGKTSVAKILNLIKRDDEDFIFVHPYSRISKRRLKFGYPVMFYLSAHGIINYEKENNLNIFTPIIIEITKFLMNSDKEITEINVKTHLKSKNVKFMNLFNIRPLLSSYRSLMYDYIDKPPGWFCEAKKGEKKSFFSKRGEKFIEKYINLRKNAENG